MLQASGWADVDAKAILMGDPLASLAREIGLPLIASQLAETSISGWLSTDRVADLNSKLSATAGEPTNAVRTAFNATAGYRARDRAEKAARDVLNDARLIITRANSEGRPLRLVYDS
jgi:hypothetical protein